MTQIDGVEVSSVKLTKDNELTTKYSYVNLVYNADTAGAFGVGWLQQAVDEIIITDEIGTIVEEEDTSADNSVYLAYAYPITEGVSAGGTIKVLMGNYPALTGESLTDVGYFGYGIDLGLLVNVGKFVNGFDLSIGLNIMDLYTTLTWDPVDGLTEGGEETVDMNIKPGVAYKLPAGDFKLVAGADLDAKMLNEGAQTTIHAGGEIWWNDMVAVRGGLKSWGSVPGQEFQQESDWSMGASIRWYFIGIDYAFVHNELSDVQYLSIIGKF